MADSLSPEERYHVLHDQSDGFTSKETLKHHLINHLREEAAQAKAEAYEDAARIVERAVLASHALIAELIRARAQAVK